MTLKQAARPQWPQLPRLLPSSLKKPSSNLRRQLQGHTTWHSAMLGRELRLRIGGAARGERFSTSTALMLGCLSGWVVVSRALTAAFGPRQGEAAMTAT